MNVGLFMNAIISFLIVAFALSTVIKGMNQLRREEAAAPPQAPTTKDCKFCCSAIPLKATKCPHCTSQVDAA